ncbi:hypothetical protein AC094_44870 [Bacteroides fragilis]|uniref:Uncharacterized protein n=1 Tax=Bacteroides fragilis TaxID=817 RepID=A0A853PP42_BACFG|nr:hypothetical protein AC094_44870 [Bacteroides fragilis]
MNGIIQILEMKNIELERTLLVEKIGISFRNSNACLLYTSYAADTQAK